MSRRRKWIRRCAIGFALVVAVWLSLSYAVAYRLTRRMNPLFAEPTPSLEWGAIEKFQLTTEGNHTINGWYIPGQPDRPVVVILHGNGACRTWIMEEAELVVGTGYGALLISMRAHGDSTGDLNDIGYGARHDVIAAIGWLEKRCPTQKIVLWGQSMGAAAALFAGIDLGNRISGYILESPYQDLKTAVWVRLRQSLPPVASHAAYAGLLVASTIIVPQINDIAPQKAMTQLPSTVPIMILAGSRDPLATLAESQALAKCAGPNCQLITLETNAHIPALRADRTKCTLSVLEFLERISR